VIEYSGHWCDLHERLAKLSTDGRDATELACGLTRELVSSGLCDCSGMWLRQNGSWRGAAFPDHNFRGNEGHVVATPEGEWVDEQAYVMELEGRSRLWLQWHRPLADSQRKALTITRPVLKMCLREMHGRSHQKTAQLNVAQLGAALASSFQLDQLLQEILQAFIGLAEAAGGELELSWPASHQRQLSRGDVRSSHLLDFPFSRQDSIRATVRLYFAHPHAGEASQMELLQAFASQACLAIENVLVHEKEQDFAREALALYRAAREIEEGLDLDDVLERSASALSKVASVDRCLIFLKDAVRPLFTVASAMGISSDEEEFFSASRLSLGALSESVRSELESGKAVYHSCSNAEGAKSGLDLWLALRTGDQCLLLPLLVKERLSGLIYLGVSRPGFVFTDNVQRLVQTLVLQVANAIQRASLLHQLQENLGPLKALYQVSTAITGTLSLNKVVKLIVEQTAELLDHSACALLVLDEIGEGFRLETSLGLNEELQEPALQAKIARTAVERKRATALYVDKDPECEDIAEVLARAGFGGLLSVPLIARKKMVGVLNCFVPLQIRFRQQEIRFLKGFANQAAIAVENARLHGLVRFKMGELGTLFEVSKAVTSTLQLDRVLEEIVRHVRDILRADACSLMLVEGPNLVLRTLEGLPPDYRCKPIVVGRGVAGIAAKMATPMILLDQDRVSDDFPSSLRQIGLRSILCVPIENRGRVLGVVNVYYKELLTPAPAQINLLNALGSQAAVAIENARLYAEKEKVTELLRSALIPKDKLEFPGIQIGHRFIPSMDLSGDYYEVIPLGPKKLVFVIADVSGKGPEAAIQTLRAKHILRSYAFAGYGPAECLRLLNQQIGRDDGARHLSLFCAEADLTLRTLRFASAGHEPPIYWNSGLEAPLFLTAEGILIGAIEETVYEERSVPIPPDSWLVLYTDGVTEARNPANEFFGMERILQSIQEAKSPSSPQRFVNNLYSRVRKFTRENITDDFSVMAIRF
jgi:serine phosphatase RsbU (regulator of sigma subunit)/putative methionine-R-sulfoxide reductase with GAF domain